MRPDVGNLKLNHVGIASPEPEKLAAWYADKLGMMLDGGFVYGDGWVLACEKGEPARDTPAHFGFMMGSKVNVAEWATYFSKQQVPVEMARDENAAYVTDPDGNIFEIFYDPTEYIPAN